MVKLGQDGTIHIVGGTQSNHSNDVMIVFDKFQVAICIKYGFYQCLVCNHHGRKTSKLMTHLKSDDHKDVSIQQLSSDVVRYIISYSILSFIILITIYFLLVYNKCRK